MGGGLRQRRRRGVGTGRSPAHELAGPAAMGSDRHRRAQCGWHRHCLGSWLIAREGREAPGMHALYGFSALVAVGIVFSYRQQLQQHVHLLYGGAGLFLMGMGIRAMILG